MVDLNSCFQVFVRSIHTLTDNQEYDIFQTKFAFLMKKYLYKMLKSFRKYVLQLLKHLYFWYSFLTICKEVQRKTTLSRRSGFLEDTWIRHKKVVPRDTLSETRILLSVAHILIDIKFNTYLNIIYYNMNLFIFH